MAVPDEVLQRRVLGWGVAAPLIERQGDVGRDLQLVLRPDTGTLDLACVIGAENLGQDLAMALTTGRGSDPFNTEFGFDGLLAFVEETAPTLLRERLRASVAKTVASDARVRAVTAIDIEDTPRGPLRALSLRLTVDTILGASTTLSTSLEEG
jgi:phage baseplate assembly protein W